MTESNKNKQLTNSQERVLPFLLSCQSYEEAAKAACISRKQIYEWRKQPLFMKELKGQRRMLIEGVAHILRISSEKAVLSLVDLLDANNESVRLRASIAILDQLNKINEIINVEERLSSLEEIFDE